MNHTLRNIASESPEVIANRLINRAECRDGLQEITVGVYLLMLAGVSGLPMVFQRISPIHSPIQKASVLGLGLTLLTLPLWSRWMIRKVRRRFLIEKVGYVKMKPLSREQTTRVLVRYLYCAGVAALVNYGHFRLFGSHPLSTSEGVFSPAGLWLAGTAILGGACAILIRRGIRYFVGGVGLAAMGIFLAFSGVSVDVGLMILSGTFGLLSLASGCYVLLLFLRQPAESGE